MGEAPDLYPLPEQTVFDAALLSCTEEHIPFTYKNGPKAGTPGTFAKWEWTFIVTSPQQEFNEIEVKGSTEPRITDATDSDFLPLARPYVEALLGRALQVGEDVDTDDLLGLPCKITVRHEKPRPRKQGDGFWYNVSIDEIFPAAGTPQPSPPQQQHDPWAPSSSDEPPF